MNRSPVIRIATKLLVAPIILFALYVQFHGDFGPGGGFQAGVILGSAFILYALIYGVAVARRVMPGWLCRLLLAGGVLIYAGTGVAGLLLGGNYLDYGPLAADPVHGQELGIWLVELGVGMTVAAAMTTIFFVYAGRAPEAE